MWPFDSVIDIALWPILVLIFIAATFIGGIVLLSRGKATWGMLLCAIGLGAGFWYFG
jgi:hypothetical protein